MKKQRNETTSKRVATTASGLLRKSSNPKVKSTAGSALTQKVKGKG
jgi:hypothetical protein